jgi:hypothetical protein
VPRAWLDYHNDIQLTQLKNCPCTPADLVSGKEVPGARLDYHDEIVRDCSWHPTQNTIVTTSFDGSVVQCVPSCGFCSAHMSVSELPVQPPGETLQPSHVLQGLCAVSRLFGVMTCIPEPQWSLFCNLFVRGNLLPCRWETQPSVDEDPAEKRSRRGR